MVRGIRASMSAMILALYCALFAAAAAGAAPPGPPDPDWPCQQIKVPRLSLAAVWSGPPPDQQQTDWRQDQPVADLVQEIARRRLPIEQAQTEIHDFAQRTVQQKQPELLQVLSGLFSVIDDERSKVVAGLDRFGARQRELAASLREDNAKLRAMQADPASNASEFNQMTQKVMWNAEVFQDRRQALRYACDVPGKIEQRLFALARTIQLDLH
jgi:hypothetical protein